MKVVIFASLLAIAAGSPSSTSTPRRLAAAKCTKDDGVADEAKAPGDGCFCGGDAESDANPKCAENKYCAKTRDGKFKCLDAKLTDKCGADAENTDKDVCGCEKEGAADVFVELCIKTDTCQKADGKCKAKEAAAAKCTKDDGVADEAKAGAAGCFCGGDAESADTPKCAENKYCAKTRDGKFKCLDAKLADKCAADAANADKDVCGCEKEGAADVFVELCIKTDTCQKADGKCKAAAAAATTTKAATTKAAGATTKAAAATTKAASAATTAAATKLTPAAAELAAKVAHKAAKAKVMAVTDVEAKAALAKNVPKGVTAPQPADTTVANGVMNTKASFDSDPNKMTGDALKAVKTYFCSAMQILELDMCDCVFTKARRLSDERHLAAEAYKVVVQMVSEEKYAKLKKDQATKAQSAALSSGASAFGFAVAIGFAALY